MDVVSTYGLPSRTLASLTGVSIETAQRWKRAGIIPRSYAELAQLKLSGDLGLISSSWSGFTLNAGKLWTPEGASVRPGDVRAIPYRLQLVQELEQRLRTPEQLQLI